MKTIFDFLKEQKEKYVEDYDLKNWVPEYIGDISLIDKIIDPDEKFLVICHVDGDCDGISSYVILDELFNQFCIPNYIHISSRKEGYGLNNTRTEDLFKLAIKKKEDEGLDDYKICLLTADLGITNKKQVSFAKDIGFDCVIITDHHTVDPESLPDKADLIVNMKIQNDEKLWLCGAGLVYMLYHQYSNQKMKLFAGNATIVDMVEIPYGSINRTIVKEAIEILRNQQIEDRDTFYFLNKVIYRFGENKIDENVFGFNIGPSINSLSRLGNEELIKEYFTLESRGKKYALDKIEKNNKNRKAIQAGYEERIVSMIKEEELDKDRIAIVVLPFAEASIVGLVSSFIMSNYGVDNLCLAPTADPNKYKGSGRSSKFKIYEFIKELKKRYDINGGGHSNACGISISKESVDKLLEDYSVGRLNDIVLKENPKDNEGGVYEINYDEMTDPSIIKTIDHYAPYGQKNPKPTLLIRNLKIINVKKSGSHMFLDCECESEEDTWETPFIKVISFKVYDKKERKKYKNNRYIDVLGSLNGQDIIADKVIFL